MADAGISLELFVVCIFNQLSLITLPVAQSNTAIFQSVLDAAHVTKLDTLGIVGLFLI